MDLFLEWELGSLGVWELGGMGVGSWEFGRCAKQIQEVSRPRDHEKALESGKFRGRSF